MLARSDLNQYSSFLTFFLQEHSTLLVGISITLRGEATTFEGPISLFLAIQIVMLPILL